MAVKLKPEKCWLRTIQPSAGERGQNSRKRRLPDPKSKHLPKLYALGTSLASRHPGLTSLAGGSGGPMLTVHSLATEPHLGLIRFPCIKRGKARPVRRILLTANGSAQGWSRPGSPAVGELGRVTQQPQLCPTQGYFPKMTSSLPSAAPQHSLFPSLPRQ